MTKAPSDAPNKVQMSASIPSSPAGLPETTALRFGQIGIPAVAAAAEFVKAKGKPEKPLHQSIYQHFVD